MREIKFRAWHIQEDEEDDLPTGMIDADSLYFPDTGLVCDALTHCSDVIMQYTGLKDKNGKEIYEGDIISIRHPYKDRGYTGEIYYNEESASFEARHFFFSHHDNPSSFVESLRYVEVIGNIHESNTSNAAT